MMPWDTALNYADRVLRIVTSSGIAPGDQLQWWNEKAGSKEEILQV